MQDLLPVLLDLLLRAMPSSTKQGRDFPFTQRYMQHVAGDVQHTLLLTGMNTAAGLTQTLLDSDVFCSQYADDESEEVWSWIYRLMQLSQKFHEINHSDQVSTVTSALCTLSQTADDTRSFLLPCVA